MNHCRVNIQKAICFLLCFFLLFKSIVPVEAVKKKVVRVGWYEDSYHITGTNGERSGYGYEHEQAIAAYTGWTYEYVKGDWADLVEMLEKGEIDLMGALSYTDERATTFSFSQSPMGEEKYYLYADLTNTNISPSNLSTLNGKRIAIMEKSVQTTQFYEWEEKNNIKTEHVFVDSFEQSKQMAENHEIDGAISTETPAWVEAGMSAVASTGGSSIYYCINKERSDLKEELDSAMRAMENDKPFYADELYQRYLTSQSTAVLSSEEKEWLTRHGDIKIGYLKNDPGVSTIDSKSGELVGVINDYIDYANNCFDQSLNFELVGFNTQQEQFAAIEDGTIDFIFHVNQNPYFAEQNDLALSNTVFSMPLAAITSQDYFDENATNHVAVIEGSTTIKWYVSYNYPHWSIDEYLSFKEAQKAVQDGEADCLIVRSGQAMRYVSGSKLHSVFLTKAGNVSFALAKGNTILMSILNKTLKTMQISKLSGAVSMYEDSLKKVTVTDFIKDNLVIVITVFVSLFAVILAVILRLLKKARDAEENAKEAQLQAEKANEAKSNFLFNMSHDIRTPMNALLGYNQLMKKELTDPKLVHYQEKIEQSGNLLLSIINNVLDMARIESGKMELDENYVQVEDVLEEVNGVFASEAKDKGLTLEYTMQVEHKHILCDVTKVQQILVNLVSNAVKYTPTGGKVEIHVQEVPCDTEGYVKFKTEVIDNGIGMSKEYLPYLFDSFTRERNTTLGKVAGTGLGMAIVKEIVDCMGGTINVESELGKGSKFTVLLEHRIANQKYYQTKQVDSTKLSKQDLIQGKRILLAEDNELNAEIAITILEEIGLKVDRVEDGIQCVSQMEHMPSGTYDLILMDIQMPNMDGYKATESIRSLVDPMKAQIPIIAMTANAFEEDRKMALARGMNGHIAKPIDIEKLEEILLSILK